MKQIRFRTVILALLVTGGSSVVGVGLGRFMTKVVLAGDKPRPARNSPSRSTATNRPSRPLQLFAANDEGDLPALHEIHISAQDVPRNQPVFDNTNFSPAAAIINPVPLWNYNFTASADRGGANFQGTIVGRSPFSRGKTTTSIATQIVPLIIKIGNTTYDPTIPDPICGPKTLSSVDVITGSPLFQNNDWTMNGVSVGNTQYLDAFQRAQFWSLVGGTNYHLMLNVTVLPPQTLTLTGANFNSGNFRNGCNGGTFGVVDINVLDLAVQNLLTGPLAGTVNVGTVPILLTKSVFASEGNPNDLSKCCILGYHSLYNVGPNIQTYSPFSLDISGVIGGDVTTLSHEIGELINDPNVRNGTPLWGGIGQVGGCQANFEVGDPLSEGFGTPTQPFTVVGANGFTYHTQELAFISWFFGGDSMGAGGGYSNNGTFQGDAKVCPPGGTN
jgi:hypothetical protein